MFVAWAVTFDIAILLMRYSRRQKHKITYAALHSLFMWVTVILSTVFISAMLKENRDLNGSTRPPGIRGVHFILGLIIFAISFTILLGGMLTLFKLRSEKKSDDVSHFKNNHMRVGYFMYIITKVNIIIGASFHEDEKFLVGFTVYIGIIILIHILYTIYD